ncbi:fumarylacetoacetate hydrolase family protein [Neobacillus cucumis]|uniref:fumarylacetoacetate hydrolase family protein n=1 Tax=Neobacillus cucumis TaxID=1740721 RepID=UPI002E214694|nr:fumarylacetoacetate hydrolase family protein [Neobacillus cucumis]
MGIYVARFENNGEVHWGVVENERIYPLKENFETLKSFLENGIPEAEKVASEGDPILALSDVKLLSPITQQAQIVCQGTNYSAHRAETGLDVKRPSFNLIFTKASSTLAGPGDEIICPPHVELLDYEIEVGLVIGKEITEQLNITKENIHEYVAGIVITNDISARDIQFTHLQWYKGKSYRTFCPTGPFLYLLDKQELSIIHNLDITLTVNGEVRQSANTSQLLFKPEETLTELSGLMNFYPGDLIMTGTPGGVAMHLTPQEMEVLQSPAIAFEEKKHTIINQKNLPNYLKAGDLICCEIKSSDGKINLGVLENKVVSS